MISQEKTTAGPMRNLPWFAGRKMERRCMWSGIHTCGVCHRQRRDPERREEQLPSPLRWRDPYPSVNTASCLFPRGRGNHRPGENSQPALCRRPTAYLRPSEADFGNQPHQVQWGNSPTKMDHPIYTPSITQNPFVCNWFLRNFSKITKFSKVPEIPTDFRRSSSWTTTRGDHGEIVTPTLRTKS